MDLVVNRLTLSLPRGEDFISKAKSDVNLDQEREKRPAQFI